MATYIRGYEFDKKKIKDKFKIGDDQVFRFIKAMGKLIPRTSYLYIGVGEDAGRVKGDRNGLHMVMVLAEGDDEEALRNVELKNVAWQIKDSAQNLVTHGIWLNNHRDHSRWANACPSEPRVNILENEIPQQSSVIREEVPMHNDTGTQTRDP